MDWTITILIGVVILGTGFLLGRGSLGWGSPKRAGDVQQVDRQRLSLILDLISTMTSTLIYNRVLDLMLDLGEQALAGAKEASDQSLVSAVYLFTPEGSNTVLRAATSRRMVQADLRATLPAANGVVSRVIEEGAPVLINQVKDDPELGQFLSLKACQSLYCMPLRVGLDAYGVVWFAHPKADFFTPERQDVLGILNHQAVIAVQNARLYNDLEQEKERMMETQEEARKKLARDLHDGPIQSVSAIAMRVNYTRHLLVKDNAATEKELEKIEDLARRTTTEIRHMLFTLRPLVLESQGLVAALQAMAEKMRDTYGQNVIVEVDSGLLPELENSKQTVIFYIVEEAVNNARKHAMAAHIWVRLNRLGNDLALLAIKDDGIGFDQSQVGADYEKRSSLGMVNMRERSELINGVLRLDSKLGNGTNIQVAIPLTEEAADRLRQRTSTR